MSHLLTIEDAAAQLGVTRGYLAQLRVTGKGPAFRAITPRTIRYAQEDIDAWVASAKRRSTSDQKSAA
jgi:predicted DNA-binding transcriptional regulator AlpA